MTNRTYQAGGGSTLIELGALDQRVQNVEKGQTALSERLDSLGAHIDRQIDKLSDSFSAQVQGLSDLLQRRSQPQVQMLSLIATIAIAVLMAFGGLASVLMSTQTGYVSTRTAENRTGILTLAEMIRNDYTPRVESDKQSAFIQKEIDSLEIALAALREDTVTQDAHQAVLDQLARLNSTVGNITPVGDVLKDMQDQIKRLQGWYFTRAPVEADPRTGPPSR